MIGDRLFGTARTLWEATQACQERDIAVLARVRDNIKVEIVERLTDGSPPSAGSVSCISAS